MLNEMLKYTGNVLPIDLRKKDIENHDVWDKRHISV